MIAEPPRPQVGVLGPALLIGLGTIALLVTSGLLGPDAAGRLLPLWPLLLVLLGVQVVVGHLLPGRAGALVALAAMLGLIALGAGLALSVPTAPTATYRASAPAAGVTAGALRLDAGPGTLRLAGQDLGGDLYRARVRYAASTQPSVQVDGGAVHLVTPRSHVGPFWPSAAAPDDVDVALASRVPWTVTLNGAGLSGRADLTGLDVAGFTLNGAGSSLDLRLPAAALRSVTVTVNGVGVNVTVQVPRQTGAHVVVEGLGTSLEVNGATVGGAAWTSPGFDAAAGRYEIRATGVGSHVRLETVP